MTGRRALARPAVLFALLAFACGGSGVIGPSTSQPAATPATARPKPNFVLVVTDDLDVDAARQLPLIPDLLADRGLTFARSYASQPLCAPSRASILTGQYTHNHRVYHNKGSRNGFSAFRSSEQQTIATWLKDAGYRTSLVGKYINDYASGAGNDYVPPGWDDWFGHVNTSEDGRYWNYDVNDNRNIVHYGTGPESYSPDVEARRAVAFIRESADRPEPLFLYLAPESPHTPANYAARFGGEFKNWFCPRPPSFNEGDVSQKPSPMRQLAPLTEAAIASLDKFCTWRLRSLRAVEDELSLVITALTETNRLANTYIIFTSDNGLLLGQHRAVDAKGNPYEEAIRVPLYVRGPDVPIGTVEEPVLNIDLAPTLCDLAGIRIPATVDGRSLVPFLRGTPPAGWRTDVLIENYGPGPPAGPSYSLRTPDWLYNHQDTEELELYDMRADPYQLKNLSRKSDPALIELLEQRIRTLVACAGESCRK